MKKRFILCLLGLSVACCGCSPQVTFATTEDFWAKESTEVVMFTEEMTTEVITTETTTEVITSEATTEKKIKKKVL